MLKVEHFPALTLERGGAVTLGKGRHDNAVAFQQAKIVDCHSNIFVFLGQPGLVLLPGLPVFPFVFEPCAVQGHIFIDILCFPSLPPLLDDPLQGPGLLSDGNGTGHFNPVTDHYGRIVQLDIPCQFIDVLIVQNDATVGILWL